MPMKMVHRPRSARRMQADVEDEVKNAYGGMCTKILAELYNDVADWQRKPVFYCKVKITRGRWQLWFGYDGRTIGGINYKRVDEGTAERGGKGRPYKIRPKTKKVLKYDVPHYPKTLPTDGRPEVGITYGETPTNQVIRQEVIHPGIWPRNFSQSLRDELSERTRIGGFKSVTEAAVKRTYRKRVRANIT